MPDLVTIDLFHPETKIVNLSLGLGIGRVTGRPVPAPWDLGDLPGVVATVDVAVSRSRGKLWQDAAKTVPAVADGDPVRVAVCPYTATEFTAPNDDARPTLTGEGGGKWSLAFDGSLDRLEAQGLSVLSSVSLAMAVRLPALGASRPLAGGSAASGAPYWFADLAGRHQLFNNSVEASSSNSTTVMAGEAWHVPAVTYDGSSAIRYYLAGAADGTATMGSPFTQSPNRLANNVNNPSPIRVAGYAIVDGELSAGDVATAAAYLAALVPA